MNFIEEAGAYAYLFTSRESLAHGFINVFEYLSRLIHLEQMLSPTSPLRDLILEEILWQPPDLEGDGFRLEEPEIQTSPTESEIGGEGEGTAIWVQEYDDGCLKFLTKSQGVLGDKWMFHQYDDDHFPSIPHGHLNKQHSTKLDVYRGYTYDTLSNNKPLKREKKRFIIDLWNNPEFRTFAVRAIDYYLEHFPTFQWRVAYPRRLPRIKRV